MDFVSSALVTLKQPSGFWFTILNGFRNGMGSYILAVIMIAIIVRLIVSVADVFNKRATMKNSDVMAKMKPELDAIQKKYGYDQKIASQKQNELYRKYQFNMLGSCLPMLISMVLQLVIFMTLWSSLQSVANYNVVEKYENMKYIYANVINMNIQADAIKDDIGWSAGDEIVVSIDGDKINFDNKTNGQHTDKEFTKENVNEFTNENIVTLINTYVETKAKDEDGNEIENPAYSDTGLNEALLKAAKQEVETYYKDTQEGFLWIKNIYRAESPTSPLFTKTEAKKYVSGYYSNDEKEIEKTHDYEGTIYDYAIAGSINQKDLGVNGYYILTIIAVLSSFFSIWLSNKLMKNKNTAQKQSPVMYIIMPLIMGVFTFMYTSLFAIYIIIGQLMMIALTPLTTLIVKKWTAHELKKKQEKDVVVVDYRRKDM